MTVTNGKAKTIQQVGEEQVQLMRDLGELGPHDLVKKILEYTFKIDYPSMQAVMWLLEGQLTRAEMKNFRSTGKLSF